MIEADAVASILASRQADDQRREELRAAARASLFFFARYVLGWEGLNEGAHQDLCGFGQSIVTRPRGFGVAEDPRGTGKSTALTQSIPAWCLIQDPAECAAKGWLPLGPDTNVLIVSYKTEYAAKFLRDGRKRMETSPIFRWLFGDLLPERNLRSPDAAWKGTAFNVRRSESATGFSVMAMGTDSAATSLHPRVVIVDDLVNEKNYKSHAEVSAQVDWLAHSFDLVDSTDGSILVVENSWTERDVNASLRERNDTSPHRVFFFSRSIVVCDDCEHGRPLDPKGNPISEGHSYLDHPKPERPLLTTRVAPPYGAYTPAAISEIVANLPRDVAWAQHFNHPLNRADLSWREEWLRNYAIEGSDVAFSFGNSPKPEENLHRVAFSDLDAIVSLDPGINRPGLACVGHTLVEGLGDAAFILEATAEKLTPRDQIFRLFEWILKYGAKRMVFEQAALQGYIGEMIPAMALAYQAEKGAILPSWLRRPTRDAQRIIGAQVFRREGDKERRIADDLGPLFEQRLVFTRGGLDYFRAEYGIFPKGKSMDVLDAIRQAIRQFKAGRRAGKGERERTRLDAADQLSQYQDAMNNEGAHGYGFGY